MAIFMIGTQRSGSNLLRLMLNQLPGIAAPHPPHILQRMMPLAEGYGRLENDESFATLVDDVCKLVELNPIPWEGVSLDRQEVAERCEKRSLVAVMGVVYDIMAGSRGAADWCCKSLSNIHYLPEIETHFDRPKYIYLYRDGRDVALSFRKAIVGEKHYYHIARDWARTQRLALALAPNVPGSRFFNISYEDMTAFPQKTLQRLCAFLGQEYHESMFDFHESTEAQQTASKGTLWDNVARPLMSGNSGKFLSQASPDDMRIFESVAGDVLDRLGYQRYYIEPGKELNFTSAHLREFDESNERMKQDILNNLDPEDKERRDRQNGFIQSIVGRVPEVGRGSRLSK